MRGKFEAPTSDPDTSCSKNVKVGTATVTLKCKGKYGGIRKLTFKIKARKQQ
ncbi:MAG: hypothetical protein K6E63_12175 [Lachnospiraceae bacterium]|nr:hypothetical protein [Lachnospiraceae bacterium]